MTAAGCGTEVGPTAVVGDAVAEGATVGGGTTPVLGDDVVDTDEGAEPSNWIGLTGSFGERSKATTTPYVMTPAAAALTAAANAVGDLFTREV